MSDQLKVALNGTQTNPWHGYGLSRNPFPQIARAERDAACLALQKLGGDPIPDGLYIRQILHGHFTEEFIELVVSKFVRGKLVRMLIRLSPKEETMDFNFETNRIVEGYTVGELVHWIARLHSLLIDCGAWDVMADASPDSANEMTVIASEADAVG